MAGFKSSRLRAGLAALALVLLAAGCLPPGTIVEGYGGPGGIRLPCSGIASSRVSTQVGGHAIVACASAVPDTVPTQYTTSVFAFTNDGTPDLTFGADGSVELPVAGTNVNTLGLAQTSDGAVWVSLLVGFDYRLYRLAPDGTVDTGFGAGGARPLGSNLRSAAIIPTGATTVRVVTQEGLSGCSGFCPPEEGLRVRDFGPTGPIGPSLIIPLNHLAEGVPADATSSRVVFDVQALGLDANLRVLVAGTISTLYSTNGGSLVLTNRDLGVIRLDSTGVDETYATGGVAKVDLGIQPDGTPTIGLGQNQGPSAVTVSHGEVVFAIGPMWNPGGMLGRLGSDGLLDPAFDGDGLVAIPGVPEVYSGLAVDGNRKIVAAVGDGVSAALRRFRPDGTVDTGFGTQGRVQMAQVAPQLHSLTVSIPLSQIHVLYGHSEQAGGSVRLLRVAS